jgi:uncharacterized protein YecT (DUF1311 family)
MASSSSSTGHSRIVPPDVRAIQVFVGIAVVSAWLVCVFSVIKWYNADGWIAIGRFVGFRLPHTSMMRIEPRSIQPVAQPAPVEVSPSSTVSGTPPPAVRSDVSLTRLTSDASRDIWPVWTPAGTILFQSNRNSARPNGLDIWEMAPDGSGQREIVRVVVSTPPEWGDPGLGAGIEVLGETAIAVYEAQHFHEIMRVATNQATALPIVRTAQDGADTYFSQLLQIPGGQSASNIIYSEANGMAAWTANVPGQGVQIRTSRLLDLSGQQSSSFGTQIMGLAAGATVQGMSYSPDGSRLVASMCFQSCGSGHGADLYLLDSRSGQMLQQLTYSGNSGVINLSPKWSPRGDWIAFSETVGEQQGLRLISISANPTIQHIDTGTMSSYGPSWSKDGSDIVFVGVTDGNHDIWLARGVAGSGGTQGASVAVPSVSSTAAVKPSFDCEKAKTPTEKLICGDSDLAAMENNMVAAYNRVVQELPADQSTAFRREHLEWFKDYARACNAMTDDEQRKRCVTEYLSNRTQRIEGQLRR